MDRLAGDAQPARVVRGKRSVPIRPFTRTSFDRSEMIFDLSSFGMSRTDEGLFASNRLMRNFSQLGNDLDSLNTQIYLSEGEIYNISSRYFSYSSIKDAVITPPEIEEAVERADSLRKMDLVMERTRESYNERDWKLITVEEAPVRIISLRKPTTKGARRIIPRRIRILSKDLDENGRLKTSIPSIDSTFSNEEILVLNEIKKRTVNYTNESRQIKTAISTAHCWLGPSSSSSKDRKELGTSAAVSFFIRASRSARVSPST